MSKGWIIGIAAVVALGVIVAIALWVTGQASAQVPAGGGGGGAEGPTGGARQPVRQPQDAPEPPIDLSGQSGSGTVG